MNRVTLNIAGLRYLREEMKKAQRARVKVGILGNKRDRFDANWNKEAVSNPDIGMRMEFGEVKNRFGAVTPARSWLRMPIQFHLMDHVKAIGLSVFRSIVMKKGIEVALENLGATAEATIQHGFNTGGWGQWRPLAGITIRKKGSSAILIDSAQFRKAVTSKVVMSGRGP